MTFHQLYRLLAVGGRPDALEEAVDLRRLARQVVAHPLLVLRDDEGEPPLRHSSAAPMRMRAPPPGRLPISKMVPSPNASRSLS